MNEFIVPRRLLFLGFVLLGMASGFFAGSLGSALAAGGATSGGAADGKSGTSGQQNSLVVLVDDLAAPQPTLLGAWLAVRSGQQVSWMPLYPQPMSSEAGYAQAGEAIRLASHDLDALGSLAPVSQAGVSFDEAYLLDPSATAALAAATGLVANDLAASGLAATWEQPQAALQQQVQLIQALCGHSWGAVSELDAVLSLMPDHLRSSLTAFDLITRWDTWSAGGFGLSCDHPWAE